MKLLPAVVFFLLLSIPVCLAQDPVTITNSRWERTTLRAPRADVEGTGPVTPVMGETKNFQRNARAQRTDNPMDPNEHSIEGRSRALDKAVRESRTPQADNQSGFIYSAELRNDTGQGISVIYWEYRFTEIARPSNVVRRQFLCAVNMKDGENKSVSIFSLLGPSDLIDVESLAKAQQKKEKLFIEEVIVNSIELADGNILQRPTWKFSEVKEGVARVTSTPWGRETCRML